MLAQQQQPGVLETIEPPSLAPPKYMIAKSFGWMMANPAARPGVAVASSAPSSKSCGSQSGRIRPGGPVACPKPPSDAGRTARTREFPSSLRWKQTVDLSGWAPSPTP